jgi:uncharacterized protein YjbJ (UPF0337 family)
MRKTGQVLAAACTALLVASPALAQPKKDGPVEGGQTIVIKRTDTAKVPAGVTTWDKVSGNWKSFRGKVRQQWGKLTHDDIAVSKGKRDVLVGKIQSRYGIDKDKADQQVDAWLKQQK